MQNRLHAVSLSALAISSLAFPSQANAQVAPTEVNEKAIDDFGLERKTGRFSWSGAEVIRVGGEDSRVSMVATSIRSPAWAETTWPIQAYKLNTNEPQLVSFPMPDEQSPIPGAISLTAANRTVSFPGGSESFKCDGISCYPEYLTGSTLESTTNGYLYTDRHGVKVYFEEYESRIVYPDGREMTYSSGKFRKNNFGFMLKLAGGSIQAVNQAIDYCQEVSTALCSSLSATRTASVSSPVLGREEITNADGEVTKLHWVNKTAKRSRRPQGADPGLFIPDEIVKYPTAITLPGSASNGITINYHAYDPAVDTHDDISVSSITRHGVTATYQYDRVFPYGIAEVSPAIHAGETLDQREGDPFQREMAYLEAACSSLGSTVTIHTPGPGGGSLETVSTELPGAAIACNEADSLQAAQDALAQLLEAESIARLPPDLRELEEVGSRGHEVYELKITAEIDNLPAGESFTLKPAGLFGSNRRRLLHVIDSSGRKTRYLFNQFEEVAGAILPEGNNTVNYYDERGNIYESVSYAKTDTNQPNLTTTLTYPADCTNIPLPRCNKPLTITDPNGNTTEYTYNDIGQVLTETKPAPAPGAARPKVVNTYTMRTAYIKNASGSPVAAGLPVSLLTSSFTCISAANCSASTPAADKVVTEYDYGPASGFNNLLLRGMTVTAANELGQIETLRTCYRYNYFGEKIAETQPKAGLTSCPG